MREKKATICQPRKRANAEARGKGRVDGATQLATIDLRAEAVRLYTNEGQSVAEIAKTLSRSERSVYAYLEDVRLHLIAEKKGAFDDKLALYLDDSFASLAASNGKLADSTFLGDALPERIDAVSRAYGILSDKVFTLLALAGRGARFAQPQQQPAEQVAGSVTA